MLRLCRSLIPRSYTYLKHSSAFLPAYPLSISHHLKHSFSARKIKNSQTISFEKKPIKADIIDEAIQFVNKLPSKESQAAQRALQKYKSAEQLSHLTQEEVSMIIAIIHMMGKAYQGQRNLSQACKYFEVVSSLAESGAIEYDINIAFNDMCNAVVYHDLREYQKARGLIKRAYDDVSPEIREDETFIQLKINALHMKGRLSYALGDIDQAQKSFEELLTHMDDIPDHDKSFIIKASYEHLGRIFLDRNETQLAIETYKEAIPMIVKYEGEENMEIERICTHLAEALTKVSQVEQAAEYLEKSYSLISKKFGKHDERVIKPLLSLRDIYYHLKDHQKFLKVCKELIKTHEALGKQNPTAFASMYIHMSVSCFSQKSYDEAKEYHEKAIEEIKKSSGEKSLEAATCYVLYGSNLRETGTKEHLVEAKESYLKANKIYKALKESKGESETLFMIGSIAVLLGNDQESTEHLKGFIEKGAQFPDFAKRMETAYSLLGKHYMERQDFESAIPYFEGVIEMIKAKKVSDELLETHYTFLGGVFAMNNELEKSEKTFRELLHFNTERYGMNHDSTKQAASFLVNVLAKQGKIDLNELTQKKEE